MCVDLSSYPVAGACCRCLLALRPRLHALLPVSTLRSNAYTCVCVCVCVCVIQMFFAMVIILSFIVSLVDAEVCVKSDLLERRKRPDVRQKRPMMLRYASKVTY